MGEGVFKDLTFRETKFDHALKRSDVVVYRLVSIENPNVRSHKVKEP